MSIQQKEVPRVLIITRDHIGDASLETKERWHDIIKSPKNKAVILIKEKYDSESVFGLLLEALNEKRASEFSFELNSKCFHKTSEELA